MFVLESKNKETDSYIHAALRLCQSYARSLGLLASVLLAVLLVLSPINLIWAVLVGAIFCVAAWGVIRYPVLVIPAVLLSAPLAAYEARAGLPIIGRLPIATGQIIFLGAVFVWLISWLIRKEKALPAARSFTWLLGFSGVMLLTVLSARSTADGGKEVVKLIQMGVMMLISLDLVSQTTRDWERPENGVWLLLGFVVLAGLSQAAIGLSQFLAADGPPSFQILGRFYRAFGTFEQPNPFGGYMAWQTVLLIGVCLPQLWTIALRFLGLSHENDQEDQLLSWPILIVLFVATGLVAGGLIASWSRGAWLAAVAGCGAMAFFLPRQRKYGVALIFVGLLSLFLIFQAGLLPASIADRLASSTEIEFSDLRDQEISPTNFAVLERQAFWQAAFGMFESRVWLGVGYGNYDAAYADYFVGPWERSLGHAHNYYINLLAETGILGLIAYLVFWGAIAWHMIRALPGLSLSQRGLALGLMGIWVALATHHLVDKLYVNNNWLTLGVFLALQELLIARNVMIQEEF